jgi:HEAT repeat protein
MSDETPGATYPFSDLRRSIIMAGYRGAEDDVTAILGGLDHRDASIRSVSVSAAERAGILTHEHLESALGDPDPSVRRRAVELTAQRREVDLVPMLHDPDDSVVEVACWAAGEHEQISDAVLDRLIELSGTAEDQLVRESATAALGAIGDLRGLPAILAACGDKPAIRRRAVLALAPFMGDGHSDRDSERDSERAAVRAAIETALADRDWQVRQAAEDLQRATRTTGDDDAAI